MNSFRPHFPRRLLARPEFIQILVFAVSIHGVEEPVMTIGHKLAFAGQPLQGLTFADALRSVEVIEYAAIEDKESGTNQSVGFGFFHEALDLTPGIGLEHSKARNRRN